jgi:tyrocidine synthetase-3
MALYNGEHLPPLKLQYKDYSEWLNSGGIKALIKKQEKYWLKQFEGDIPELHLPIDFIRPPIRIFEGNSIDFFLGTEESAALRKIAREENATLFMVLLALYNVLLSKICNQEDIIIGTPVVGRQHEDLRNIIGLFVNLLALRNNPAGQKTFKEFLWDVREGTLAAYNNQEYLFEDLVNHLRLERNPGRNPLFDIVFSFLDGIVNSDEITEVAIPGLKLKPYGYRIRHAKYDLHLYANAEGEKFSFIFVYYSKLFKEKTIHLIVEYFKNIVTSVIANPGQKLNEIFIGSDKKKISMQALLSEDLEME